VEKACPRPHSPRPQPQAARPAPRAGGSMGEGVDGAAVGCIGGSKESLFLRF